MGEHLLCKQGVIGSNPFTSTRVKQVWGSAPNPAKAEPWNLD